MSFTNLKTKDIFEQPCDIVGFFVDLEPIKNYDPSFKLLGKKICLYGGWYKVQYSNEIILRNISVLRFQNYYPMMPYLYHLHIFSIKQKTKPLMILHESTYKIIFGDQFLIKDLQRELLESSRMIFNLL